MISTKVFSHNHFTDNKDCVQCADNICRKLYNCKSILRNKSNPKIGCITPWQTYENFTNNIRFNSTRFGYSGHIFTTAAHNTIPIACRRTLFSWFATIIRMVTCSPTLGNIYTQFQGAQSHPPASKNNIRHTRMGNIALLHIHHSQKHLVANIFHSISYSNHRAHTTLQNTKKIIFCSHSHRCNTFRTK